MLKTAGDEIGRLVVTTEKVYGWVSVGALHVRSLFQFNDHADGYICGD